MCSTFAIPPTLQGQLTSQLQAFITFPHIRQETGAVIKHVLPLLGILALVAADRKNFHELRIPVEQHWPMICRGFMRKDRYGVIQFRDTPIDRLVWRSRSSVTLVQNGSPDPHIWKSYRELGFQRDLVSERANGYGKLYDLPKGQCQS